MNLRKLCIVPESLSHRCSANRIGRSRVIFCHSRDIGVECLLFCNYYKDDGQGHVHRDLEVYVAEPPELFRLKCVNDRYAAIINSTRFKRNNPLVCRVSARYNHGSTGSKQAYLARRRVYNHRTAHQLLIYRYSNIITNQVQTQINLYKPSLN
jgi:hypothetical protein